jgi:hypothetical protein
MPQLLRPITYLGYELRAGVSLEPRHRLLVLLLDLVAASCSGTS